MRILAVCAFALVTGVIVGCCIERQEIREQHCAQLAGVRHGWHKPTGVYSTSVQRNYCYARLYDGTVTPEGALDDAWRPE